MDVDLMMTRMMVDYGCRIYAMAPGESAVTSCMLPDLRCGARCQGRADDVSLRRRIG